MTQFIDISETEKKEKKETVFTHIQSDGWEKTNIKPNNYDLVKYLGKCIKDGDMFSALLNGYIDIFKGIKGDEFN